MNWKPRCWATAKNAFGGKFASLAISTHYDQVENAPVYYECQRCTNCCKWPGQVALTEGDVTRIAGFLGLEEREFVAQWTRLRADRRGLDLLNRGVGDDGACIFLEGRDCRIQPVKPVQCAGFPNTWNFPGWREVCEAIPVPLPAKSP